MRRSLLLVALLAAVAVAGTPGPARAQYMYLDSNGDGVGTAADRLSPNGMATTVDVWLRTNVNRDGSPAVCETLDGDLTINSYVVNLAASAGTVSFSGYVNRQSLMNDVLHAFQSNMTEMTVGRGATFILPPGDYKLLTVTVTGLSGTPGLAIVGSSGLQLTDFTSFGSACSGPDFDNTMQLGRNWTDADGLGPSLISNNPPVVTAPATASGVEGAQFTVTATASDADANPLYLSQSNNTPFLPASTTTGPVVNPALSLSGVPGFAAAGSYLIQWTAVQNGGAGLSATANTAVSIADGPTQNPIITAPVIVQGQEFIGVSVTGSASDPDGTDVTLSQTNNAPFFPVSSSSSGPSPNPSITLDGTPNFTQAGSYTINWSAVDSNVPAGTVSATTAVTIGGHRNPVVFAPASVLGTEGLPVSITASAASPDGAFVRLCVAGVPVFLSGQVCVGPALNPSITITGTPNLTQAGSYTIQWTATDTVGGAAAATTVLTIADADLRPVLDQPADMTASEGGTATQQLTAHDADGGTLLFAKVGPGPVFMSVSSAGLVTLAPGYSDAGNYTGTVTVSDGASSDTKSFGITVVNYNRCPVANPGGPYFGVIGAPVTFDGTGSSDPDGDALDYQWDFGDRSAGTGATVSHIYQDRGFYSVTLTVGDGGCSAWATTTVFVTDGFSTLAFTTGGNSTTSLGSGKPFTCVELEPVAGSFDIANVDLSSIRMVSEGTGSVSEIAAVSDKTSVGGDKNGNGVTEIRACFAKSDLRLLFSALPAGRNVVAVAIEGSLTTGGSFRATLDLTVKSTGGALAASVSPNPLNPSARLTFATSKPGTATVELYDLNGRLLRTLVDGRATAAGYHDVTIDGRSGGGQRLSSGVYFVKIRTEHDGTETIRLTILK